MICLWLAALAAALGARAQESRLVCARDPAGRCVAGQSDPNGGYNFVVNGVQVTYKFIAGDSLDVDCRSSVAIDEPALPHFEPTLRVRKVRLARCWPRARSYMAALRAFNVNADGLTSLTLSGVSDFNSNMLADMPTLRNLTISYTTVSAADLALLPPGLERLNLLFTRTGNVSAAALVRLSHLGELAVEDREPVLVEAAGNLSSLFIKSPGTLVSLSLPKTLASLELWGWAERRPQPWRSCAGLHTLLLHESAAEELADGWLAGCGRLRTLGLERARNLTALAPGALRGATALEEVRLRRTALEALPAGLLDDARALRVLNLFNNRLRNLPGELFGSCESLHELNLVSNMLSSSALDALTNVTSLTELWLESNLALDACPPARGTDNATQGSALRNLKNLTFLGLAATATQRLCADWRQLPRLQRLDLINTDVTRLNYTDLQFSGTENVRVELSDCYLSLRREEYARVAAAPASPTLTLGLSGVTRCDCELYWAAAALRLDKRLREVGAVCESGSALSDVPLDALVCRARGACPAGCACGERDDVQRPGRVLQVVCAGAQLQRVPRFDARTVLRLTGEEPVALLLNLADNRIDRLAPEDLPPELAALDLRNNALGELELATVEALAARAGSRVLLAGNRLHCGCRAAAALAALRARPDVFRDWADVACSDDTPLYQAALVPCDDGNTTDGIIKYSTTPVPKLLWGRMSAGAVAAVALGAVAATGILALVLARAALRWRLRVQAASAPRLEHLQPTAGEWLYDAFVSFAHADEAVVRALVARLEDGAAPLRLCVHYRDWVPGGWIPAQIAASVRVSRRTVAVVSESFLRSKWARAEFREAYAAALEDSEPRLVLVLLEEPARLPLDAELLAYISGNTYVRWGDPWFWQKLRSALPGPNARPAMESSPSTPLPTPPPSPQLVPSTTPQRLLPGPERVPDPGPLCT